MANLIPLEQAAAILGMTAEQITELRSNNEIFGYRDGANWKFKMTELERVAAEMDIQLNMDALAAGADSSDINLIADSDSSLDILTDDSSSDELIKEDSSVEIFSKPVTAAESALKAADDELGLEDSGLSLEDSGLNLEDSGDVLPSDESVVDEEDLSFGSSSLSLASESSKKLTGSDTGDLLDDLEESEGGASDTGKLLEDGDDMMLEEDDLFGDDLSIADSSSFEDSAELSSDFEDSDLVMEDSDSSSEVVLEANESGINLSPNESGISLEEDSLELGGSDIDSLELPEDDDDDIILLEDPADPESATVMQEDDFNLTPLEESMEDESSGSQVIALEDSEIYADESSPTILAESADLGSEPAMIDDTMGFEDPYGMGGALAPAGMATAGVGAAAAPEAPYTVYQVVSLGLVAGILALGAMISYDLARNMWMPDDQVLNSGVLKLFLDLVGMG